MKPEELYELCIGGKVTQKELAAHLSVDRGIAGKSSSASPLLSRSSGLAYVSLHKVRLVRRLRPCGSRRARSLAGKASARGCCRSHRWSRPCALPGPALDPDARYNPFWRRCTSSASTSRQFPRLWP